MDERKQLSRGDRSGVLLEPEQRPTDLAVLPTGVREEASTLRVEILVELCRGLIRENPSPDVLYFALSHAQHTTGASDEEMELLKKAVARVKDRAPWPKGFF
jgi:hypothetical protein